jgi:hypothetical protein
MKKIISSITFALLTIGSIAQKNQPDSTGLGGDNFSLQGALDLFSKANSLEEFETALNSLSNHVNNLDLNDDGEVDYVRVIDNMQDDAHAFVLQVPVDEKESQDVAVITLEKTGEASAQIQIVGDEELYGEGIYVEPAEEKAVGGKGGPSPALDTRPIVLNVWLWPSVQFVYVRTYRPWVSPYRWRAYPMGWKPWKPYGWRAHWGHCKHYNVHYHVVNIRRCHKAHGVYASRRVVSARVHNKYTKAHEMHKANSSKKDKEKTNGAKGENAKGDNQKPNKDKGDKVKGEQTKGNTDKGDRVNSGKPAKAGADKNKQDKQQSKPAANPNEKNKGGKGSKGNAQQGKGGAVKGPKGGKGKK